MSEPSGSSRTPRSCSQCGYPAQGTFCMRCGYRHQAMPEVDDETARTALPRPSTPVGPVSHPVPAMPHTSPLTPAPSETDRESAPPMVGDSEDSTVVRRHSEPRPQFDDQTTVADALRFRPAPAAGEAGQPHFPPYSPNRRAIMSKWIWASVAVFAVAIFVVTQITNAGEGPLAITEAAAPPCSSVGLHAAASRTAPDSVDAAGDPVSYPASNLTDGDPETAWRVRGSGVGESVTITFDEPCLLSSVGILNGYQKVDATDQTDRWAQNRRIKTGEWQVGQKIYPQTFDVNSRDPSGATIPVGQVVDSPVAFTIVATGPKETERNITAISEVIIS